MSSPPVYTNRTGRPPGRSLRALGVVLPGIARVRAQAEPYADAWLERTRAAAVAPGRRWVVLGDSMSQAIGATGPDRGWVDQLLGRLGDAGDDLRVVNLSATGARVPDVLDQQLPAWAALPPSRSPLPDLVTVMIGSNDLFSGARHRARLPGAMAELVTRLPAGSVVTTLPQPRAAARQANRHLDEAALRGHLRVVDLRTDGPSSWRGRLAADFFHPNEAGYAAITDAFEPVVRSALRTSSRPST